jgi:hypothetical protein
MKAEPACSNFPERVTDLVDPHCGFGGQGKRGQSLRFGAEAEVQAPTLPRPIVPSPLRPSAYVPSA